MLFCISAVIQEQKYYNNHVRWEKKNKEKSKGWENQQRKLLAWPQFKPTEENEQIHEHRFQSPLENRDVILEFLTNTKRSSIFEMDFMAK